MLGVVEHENLCAPALGQALKIQEFGNRGVGLKSVSRILKQPSPCLAHAKVDVPPGWSCKPPPTSGQTLSNCYYFPGEDWGL